MAKGMFFIFWVFLLSTIGDASNNRVSSPISCTQGRGSQKQDVPFNLNEVIGRVSHRQNEYRFSNSETGEFLIDTNIVYVPNPFYQMSPSIAFDGTNYLVVWEDDRNTNDIDIYGVRVNQAGFILDPDGILISGAINDQQFPSVTFDGTNYLVVWQDERSNDFSDIYGARVNQGGTVLDPGGFVISNAQYDQFYPRLTFDSINYFVVWQDMRNNDWDIYGARINQGGILIDTNGIAITVANDLQGSPSVTSSGDNNFVVWHDNRSGNVDIYGARVNFSGAVLDTAGIAISTATHEQGHPSVAFDGTNYLVVWDDYRIRTRGIYGARVTQDGIVLDTNGICISLAEMDRIRPSVNFDGTNYFVVWQDFRNHNWDIYGARVNQVGVVLDPDGIAIDSVANEQRYSSLAFDGTNYLVVWEDFRSGFNWDIYGARVSQIGSVIDANGFVLTDEVNSQYSPSVAFDGTNYLVVWHDSHCWPNLYDIYGMRVSQTGSILDTFSIPISSANYDQQNPSVVFNGTYYFIAWVDYRNGTDYPDIYGARVSQDGMVIDTNGIAISTRATDKEFPCVVSDGANYFIAWDEGHGAFFQIYGARVNQTGVVLDTNGFAISNATFDAWDPSVAFDGTNYFVVWTVGFAEIYGARVSQTGIVLDTNGIAITNAPYPQWYPSVAFDGNNYFLVWQDERNGGRIDIYGARVNQAGVVLDSNGRVISTQATWFVYPSVVFDGTNYFVAWDNQSDIYGAKVNPSGLVIDSFPISTQTGRQTTSSVALGTGNQVFITYSGWTDSINHHPVNTMRIWGKFYPFVGIEQENSKVKMQRAKLFDNYPNPFRNSTMIKYALRNRGEISIKIYDIAGKSVCNLIEENQEIGAHAINWNGRDNHGEELPAGVYICRLITSEGDSETKEIIIIR